MPKIKQYSQSLDALLRKLFNEEEFLTLEKTFLFTLSNGGLKEIDFTRTEGQSFNPRPARMAQIVLKNSSLNSFKIINSSFLACIKDECDLTALIATKILEYERIPNDQNKIDEESKVISLALLLDRARHLHLSKEYLNEQFRKNFYTKVKTVLKISGSSNEKLNLLIGHWLKRDQLKKHAKNMVDK